MSQGANASVVNRIIEQGAGYGSSNVGEGQRVLLEFVSANPKHHRNIRGKVPLGFIL
jgi:arginyl-tRNA synthetase